MGARWPGRVALGVFLLQFVALDVASRGARDLGLRRALACVASVALLSALVLLARSKPARVVLAVAAGAVFVLQAFAIRYYHAPFDVQSARSARRAWGDVGPTLLHVAPAFLGLTLAAALAEWLLLVPMASVRPRSRRLLLAVAALALAVSPPLREGTPEARAASMAAALIEHRPTIPKGTVALPLLPSRRARLPSILLVVTESVRAEDYCRSPAEPCDVAPAVHAALPTRVPLRELRAVASYTTISVGAIVTGRTQIATLHDLAFMPNLFDFAGQIQTRGEKMRAGYWGAHIGSGVFERPQIGEGLDRYVAEETLPELAEGAPDPGLDRRVVDVFERDLPALSGPLVAMLHLYGTHVPYVFDDATAPYKPFRRAVTWEHLDELHAAYRNAIRAQDVEIARAIRVFLRSREGQPWLIVLTSDHGEAFGEHHAIHHGQNLYDEQIHVPGFIAWSEGLLDDDQTHALRAAEGAPTSHLDLLPTLLDALGVWDSVALGPFRHRMVGRSLLAPAPPRPRQLPMTSCNESFPCPQNTWGMLGDRYALVAQSWDGGFHCVPLDDSGAPAAWNAECEALRIRSRETFPLLPSGKANE